MKKRFLFAVLSVFIIGGFLPSAAMSEPIELVFGNFFPPMVPISSKVIVPWAKKIEAQTNNQVKFKFIPMDLTDSYDGVLKGKADIALIMPASGPKGSYPLTSVMNLPFMVKNAESGSILYWQLYQKYMKDEYKDFKVLSMFAAPAGHIHTRDKEIKLPEDLKGLRIITGGSNIVNAFVKKVGAIPTNSIDAADGQWDAVLTGFSGLGPLGYAKDVKYHTVLGLYAVPFIIGMNKEKYASLPVDVQKVIEENIGDEFTAAAGNSFVTMEDGAMKFTAKKGGKIRVSTDSELEIWKDASMFLGQDWITEKETAGLPGQEVLETAMEILLQVQ